MYLKTLNELISKCAEFTLYPTVITLNPDWEVFTKSVDKFFKDYQLTGRKEYKSYNLALSSNSSYLLAGETIQTKVLGVLVDLRKYSSSVPKYFDRVFISHSSKDLDVGEAHNEFKDNLIKELRLPPVANWPQIREEFLSEIANK